MRQTSVISWWYLGSSVSHLRRQEEQRRLQRLERRSRPIPESILTLLPTLPPDECAAILRAYRSITPPPEAA